MLAYHNDPRVKRAILLQLAKHREADEIVQGVYWENGKGCAVGCTLHSGDHAEYEPRFGIPTMLARLEDRVFEGLPNEQAKEWPIEFMGAIRPGADLSRVGWAFLAWLLTDKEATPGIDHPLVRDSLSQCAAIVQALAKGETVAASAACAAASAAWSAASAARSAAASAAWSAASAARSAESAAASAESAAASAESAAWSAAASAESAAASAESAARSAAWSAESAAWSAESAAAWIRMARKMLELLRAAPMGAALEAKR